jgi:integrase
LLRDIAERPAPRYAHNIFDDVRALFGWCVDVADRRAPYKLTASPCDRIKPTKLIGRKAVRTRVLSDSELQRLWQVTEAIGPAGAAIRLLMLSGVRLNEAAGARWSELDIKARLWVIPEQRFKSGAQHTVPITGDLLQLLESLPRSERGEFLFSNSHGKRPIGGFSHVKRRIDELMGDVAPWSFHDIRRTLRTRLAALRIDDKVAELVIGHGKRGLDRVYEQHKFEAEIREALEAWQAKLRAIVSPSDNVVALPVRA